MTDSPKNELGEMLMNAAQSGDTKRVLRLIADGAPLEYKGGGWHATALSSACFFQREDTANALLDVGADPMATDRDNDTCLTLAQKLCPGVVRKMEKIIAAPKNAEPQQQAPLPAPKPGPTLIERQIYLDGRRIKEIFDFAARERRTYDLYRGDMVVRESFSVIDDKETLQEMLDKLRAQGLQADDKIIYGRRHAGNTAPSVRIV